MRGPGSFYGSDTFQSIAGVIGAEAAAKLCEKLGGATMYVPRTIGAHHPISVAVGPELAAKIAEHFHRTRIAIPKGLSRRERVLEYRRTTDMTIQDIALACDYTEAGVYKILAEDRGGQLDLFNTRIK